MNCPKCGNEEPINKGVRGTKKRYICRSCGKYFTEQLEATSKPKEKGKNRLIIPDLHEPFTRHGYLEFCLAMYHKWKCDSVLFLGDILDNHFTSFHEIDPDGLGAADELRIAREHVYKWHKFFPNADVCIGNHDLIPNRKAFNSGMSSRWIKTISEVLETPTWNYSEEFIIDNVLYVHGQGRKARNRMKDDAISVVQGHYHSESYIDYAAGKNNLMFAMQLGCGVDDKSYAMAYGRNFKKMHINVGVILENGRIPIIEYMQL